MVTLLFHEALPACSPWWSPLRPCLPAGLTNAGVLTSAALLASALARPSLLSLPYAVLVCYGILLWALQRRSSWNVPAIRTFQLYCGEWAPVQMPSTLISLLCARRQCHRPFPKTAGLHIILLYLWQISPLRDTSLSCAAPWLGLYTVTDSQGSFRVLLPEVKLFLAICRISAPRLLNDCHQLA